MSWYQLWHLAALPGEDGKLPPGDTEGILVVAPWPPNPDLPMTEADMARHGEGVDIYDGDILGVAVQAESPDMAILRGEMLVDEYLANC